MSDKTIISCSQYQTPHESERDEFDQFPEIESIDEYFCMARKW